MYLFCEQNPTKLVDQPPNRTLPRSSIQKTRRFLFIELVRHVIITPNNVQKPATVEQQKVNPRRRVQQPKRPSEKNNRSTADRTEKIRPPEKHPG